MTIKSLQGTLSPNNPVAITKQTVNKINKAVRLSGLSSVIKPSPAWHQGILIADLSSTENNLTGFGLMSNLWELIHAEGIEELALGGTLIIKTDDPKNRSNTKEFKIHVETGNIVSEEIKFSHLSNPKKSPLNPVLQNTQPMTVLVTEGFKIAPTPLQFYTKSLSPKPSPK